MSCSIFSQRLGAIVTKFVETIKSACT